MSRPRNELVAILATGLAHFVLGEALGLRLVFIVGACLFWTWFVAVRARTDPKALAAWGFAAAGFRTSVRMLVPPGVLATIGFIAYGYWTGSLLLHWHVVLIGLLYPAWGLVQQFLVVALLAGNLKRRTDIAERPLILLTAAIFAAAHAPSPSLAAAAFALALITTTVYFRTRNLWSLGLFHGWYATTLYYFALGRDPWQEVVSARMWP